MKPREDIAMHLKYLHNIHSGAITFLEIMPCLTDFTEEAYREKKMLSVLTSEKGFGTCKAISREGKTGSALPETYLNKEYARSTFCRTGVNK